MSDTSKYFWIMCNCIGVMLQIYFMMETKQDKAYLYFYDWVSLYVFAMAALCNIQTLTHANSPRFISVITFFSNALLILISGIYIIASYGWWGLAAAFDWSFFPTESTLFALAGFIMGFSGLSFKLSDDV